MSVSISAPVSVLSRCTYLAAGSQRKRQEHMFYRYKDQSRQFSLSFTNQGSVEVCGKAVNRGGGLGMEIPCVYIFDGPRKHVDLLEQLLDVSNNPVIRTEDDPGTARSKQVTSKRKSIKSNDRNKKPRK